MSNSDNKEGDNFMAIAIIFFIVFIVAVVTFSAYLLIDITKVSNLSNVHVTKNIKMAANDAKGNLYSDPQKGIKNWIVYADRQNGFEIKYPNEYEFERSNSEEGRIITLKRKNASHQGTDSLSCAVYVDVKRTSDSASLKEELERMGILWKDEWKQEDIGGRSGIRTGNIKDSEGREREMVIWQFGGKIFSLQEYHFNEDSARESETFKKIISEFKFL
ncbi:MAG: hypothetical protein ACD_5C00289G0003 [uncultured bacterium]|nr:MAG: hypothetical protein ACD_5C00289G0003 [uncultured bacterium]